MTANNSLFLAGTMDAWIYQHIDSMMRGDVMAKSKHRIEIRIEVKQNHEEGWMLCVHSSGWQAPFVFPGMSSVVPPFATEEQARTAGFRLGERIAEEANQNIRLILPD